MSGLDGLGWPDSNWPEQGIHHGVPFATYRACDITNQDDAITSHGKSVSKSLIVDFIADPAAWKARPKKVATKAMRAGSLFDCLLTDCDSFDGLYTVSEYDEFRTNDAKAWKKEVESRGQIVIKRSELEDAQQQVAAVYAKPEAAALLKGASFQVAFRHKTKHKFWSKGLIDVLPNDGETIVDIKTCDPRALESHRSMMRHICEWGYHIQAGAYCEGYSHASGEERHKFKFIFVGSAAPHTCAVVELPLRAIMAGADIYRNGANQLAECFETNRWPSIWDGEVELDIPEWGYNELNQIES